MTVDNHADAPFIYLRLKDRNPARADNALALTRVNGETARRRTGTDSFGLVHPDRYATPHCRLIRERPFSEIWRDTRSSCSKIFATAKRRWWPLFAMPMAVGLQRQLRARAEAATGDYFECRRLP
jgi:hypothetical protein